MTHCSGISGRIPRESVPVASERKMTAEQQVRDLSALWEAHCRHEFGERDVDATMKTMVPEPYVNHIPTMTGGVGQEQLRRFYTHHFVNANPEDTKLIPISRTVGTDRVVDEMLFCFTHTREIDWMLPGIPPTGKYVEVPLVAIVCFRGDKLYNEHIYWVLGSGLGAGADRQAGSGRAPGRGHRIRPQARRQDSAVQHAHGGVDKQRWQARLEQCGSPQRARRTQRISHAFVLLVSFVVKFFLRGSA
jgi:hypothetical protein